ncbi:MAG TPA: helix-turn-helix domain-containing protein [Pirellulales bacterium]|nr:helix-turn-helix domain-containing protein [Pirellulales bacterium]
MPPSRASANELARLLEAVATPLYVVNDERKIIFCNRACCDWTGLAAEQLLSQECRYHSSPDTTGAAAIAAALCPPPEAFLGRRTSAGITLPKREGEPAEAAVQWRAEFVPLGSEAPAVRGVLTLVSMTTAADTGEATAEMTSAELHSRIQQQRRRLAARYHIDRLWGDSPAMRQVRAQVVLAAAGKGSVAVIGPEGSGREHVVRAIHYAAGPVKAATLVPLACPLLDSDLLQAALRTLARGKSSDAVQSPALLLNDVDLLPAPAQIELARAMARFPAAFRVFSTAREPLADLATRQTFRGDLACLLSTLTIRLPALVERPEDLPLAAQWFLEQANSRSAKQVSGFSPEALDRMADYGWPGDLTELEAMVGEVHAGCKGPEIDPGDLPPRIAWAADAAAHPRKLLEAIDLEQFLAKIERELIERAIEQARGNKTKAAQMLGMTRPRFYRRLVQLGMAADGEETLEP